MDKTPENKVCDACGEGFGCGANLDGCWCRQFELSEETAAALKQRYDDCLCPKCLARLSGESAADKSLT